MGDHRLLIDCLYLLSRVAHPVSGPPDHDVEAGASGYSEGLLLLDRQVNKHEGFASPDSYKPKCYNFIVSREGSRVLV